MVLPAGGGPVGRWLHVAFSGWARPGPVGKDPATGARLRAPTPGLAPGWGPGDADPGNVLSSTGLRGRCYWEVDWSGEKVVIAVSYRGMKRKGTGDECEFGRNDQSWSLRICKGECSVWHKKERSVCDWISSLGGVSSDRVGVSQTEWACLIRVACPQTEWACPQAEWACSWTQRLEFCPSIRFSLMINCLPFTPSPAASLRSCFQGLTGTWFFCDCGEDEQIFFSSHLHFYSNLNSETNYTSTTDQTSTSSTTQTCSTPQAFIMTTKPENPAQHQTSSSTPQTSSSFLTVPDLRKHWCEFSLDPNTAHRELQLSDDKQTVTCVEKFQSCQLHKDRFTHWPQVLSSTGLRGRCYWEVDWSGVWGVL
ncbi:hypothetical protein WMY93_032539 [Mugilogobius chulae]|uniref:SPRY-associated domain-containing protein n=1 Tax=Mugilogobius chulae TaxID=88201 RepID=A0AAW0MRK2_9GOBI